MCRTLDNIRNDIRTWGALLLLCLAALLSGRAAHAGAYTYGTGAQRTVNAGILILNDQIAGNANPAGRGADDKDPYVFYVLNQRGDIKPFGWNIVNPLAPPSVTPAIALRWKTRNNGAGPDYQLGQTVSPAMAAYWEVPLSTTNSNDLAQFDVLFLNVGNASASPTFSVSDSEKLRRFVDGGGTLWVENSVNASAVSITLSNLFFSLTYNSTGTTPAYAVLPSSTAVDKAIGSPLITSPYLLSQAELNTLGDKHVGVYSLASTDLNPVLENSGAGNAPIIATASFGAGRIVATCTGSANTISGYAGGVDIYGGGGPNSGPFSGTNFSLAPTQDLKLVADILGSADSHTSEHQNGHQNGVTASPIPSAVQTWTYSPQTPGAGPATGAVVNGHISYVVTSDGVLRAFDLFPSEDLNGDGDPDDGDKDFDQGTPYDQVWHANVGTFASAPTVGVINGTTYVFVEQKDGAVLQYDTTSATPATPLATLSGGRGDYSTLATPMAAPAPTVYGNRVYAGGADGSLYVKDYTTGASAINGVVYSPDASAPTNLYVTASPTVGLVPTDDGGSSNGSDILAVVATNVNLYSVYLGTRGEKLGGTNGNYPTKLTMLTGGQIDTNLPYAAYSLGAYGVRQTESDTPQSASYNSFGTAAASKEPVYAEYDTSFVPGTGSGVTAGFLTRTAVGGSSQANTQTAGYSAMVSAPALDRYGNVYYTVTDTAGAASGDSVLVSFHDSPNPASVRLNWRFRLPQESGGLDADGASYDNLIGFKFTTADGTHTAPSAPVVDALGNVYVLASNHTGSTAGAAAILCFNALADVTADIVPNSGGTQVSSVTVTQPIGGSTDEFNSGSPANISAAQYTVSAGGRLDFTNFGLESSVSGAGAAHGLYPNLNEPYPITVQYSLGQGQNAVPQNQILRPLHTNVSWYSLPGRNATSGLTEVGNALYFMDDTGSLDRFKTNGLTITNKVATLSATVNASAFVATGNTGIGATTAVPSAANGAMIVAGPVGVAAFTNQVTLVVDNNRVLEMDSSGDAEWAVDSTTQTAFQNGAGTVAAAGQATTTTLELNHPSSLTELTQNDYLVADTGNNRCVRFDRAGKVIWELTSFNDATSAVITAATGKTIPVTTPGEPLTLNQPTSVQIRSEQKGGYTVIRYLISDTGNFRIVEVDDIYDQNFQLVGSHILRWVSHTQDVQGRSYRYQSAAYYYDGFANQAYVVALVTNTRIATPPAAATPTGALAPANQDAPGGSIVRLDYDPTGAHPTTQKDGYITNPTNVAGKFTATVGGKNLTLLIRNPRYLKAYTPSTATAANPIKHFLLADDNGVWDLDQNLNAVFGFAQADYQAMTLPILAGQATFSRAGIPFIPGSIQLLGSDTNGGHYLITNTYSQGEAANDPTKIGGEVFEVDQGAGGVNNPIGGYSTHTLSRPTNTAPLSQPSFAYRLQ